MADNRFLFFFRYLPSTDQYDGENLPPPPTNALVLILLFCFRYLPSTDQYDGENFFTTAADGARVATPLLLALVCVELSDVLFAVDSVSYNTYI